MGNFGSFMGPIVLGYLAFQVIPRFKVRALKFGPYTLLFLVDVGFKVWALVLRWYILGM